jgi:hypothetical protein
MEIVKSKRANIVVLIFGFIFFFSACAFAQIERALDSTSGNIKRYASNPILLKSPLIGDPIQLNAFSDSIDAKTITFAIFIYFPENINFKNKDLVVTFTDGTFEIFQQASVDEEVGYASYETPYEINSMVKKEVKSILIRGVANYELHKQNRTFFKDFFAAL